MKHPANLVRHDATIEIAFRTGHTVVHEFNTFTLMRPQNVANHWIDDDVNQNF